MTENFQSNIAELTPDEELKIEKNLILFFQSPMTVGISKFLPFEMNVMNLPMIGQHLGIVTDRRSEGFSTNREIHQKRDNYFFADKYKTSWKIFLRKLILNRIYAQFQEISKKTILLEHPSSNFASDILAECLPNAKVIILNLDGRTVVTSQLSSLLNKNKNRDENSKNKISLIESQSKRWVKMIEILTNIEKNSTDTRILSLKCEDVIKNTLINLKKFYAFIDTTMNESNLNLIKEQIQAYVEKEFKTPDYESYFTEEEKSLIEKIMRPSLSKLGY